MARIVVVEDDDLLADEIEQTLTVLGYEVMGRAATSDECLTVVQRVAPDLVLMDVKIRGERDGIDTALRLKQLVDVPVVYLTGFSDDQTLRRAKQTAAHGYLVKPFRTAELKSAVEIALFKHQMEGELRRREHWFSAMLRAIGDGVVAVDPQEIITFANPAAKELIGAQGQDLVGIKFGDVYQLLHRRTREPVDAVRAALRQRVPVRLPPGAALIGPTGDLPIEESVAPIIDSKGTLMGAVAVLRDVREREALHERIAASDRLASLGTLAAGVAHEINNPLTYILANAAMAERELGQWQDVATSPTDHLLSTLRRDLSEIEDGAERIRRIVADLGLFARPHSDATHGDLGSALNWAIRVTSTLVKSRARLVLDIDSVPRVRGDTTRLGQVFVNLLVNAAQAIEEGEPENNRVTVSASASGPSEVVVTISDTGTGMTQETMRRIFEPFFTTKPVGAGTGLGLSVCKGIVESLDGELTVESQRGVGSSFRVYLPRAVSEPIRPSARTESPRLRGRVLVVDDDEIVAKSVARMLASTHDVQVVNDARVALEMLLHGASFDVVVCDLLMPHLSGIEIYKKLLETRPEQAERFVFMSGAFTAEASEFLERVSNPRLPKPPSLAELERCVQTILRASPNESGYHRLDAPRPAALKASSGED